MLENFIGHVCRSLSDSFLAESMADSVDSRYDIRVYIVQHIRLLLLLLLLLLAAVFSELHDQLASAERHASLTRCLSAAAGLLVEN